MQTTTDLPVYLERLPKTLKQGARNGFVRSPEECLDILRQVTPLCGEASRNRKMCTKIGLWLLTGGTEIVAPVCPDYSHHDGRYDFRELRGGVPLLGEKHISFLERVVPFIPNAEVTLLLADHEADDVELCKAVGKSREEFSFLVQSSVLALQASVSELGWKVRLMTELIPDLIAREKAEADAICRDEALGPRIRTDTAYRQEMYWRINYRFTHEEQLMRTIMTASQYVAMGRCAEVRKWLLCNHTTTNLNWYLQTGAAFLHNPISVY